MRHVFVIAVALILAAAAFILKKHREKIIIGAVIVLCLINGAYSYTRAESILPSRHPFNQTFYTSDYVDTLEFPDAFLRLYLEGRTVYVKDDAIAMEDAVEKGYYWEYAYNHYHDLENYMEAIHAVMTPDKSMNDYTVSDERMGDFEALGYLNDLLRNTAMYSKYDSEIGNYLYHIWYYRDFTAPVKIYVNAESLKNTEYDEVVLIWQRHPDPEVRGESEDMYLMSREYYEEVIK